MMMYPVGYCSNVLLAMLFDSTIVVVVVEAVVVVVVVVLFGRSDALTYQFERAVGH